MANTTHHVKSDIKHRKEDLQQPKAQPGERMNEGERQMPQPKTAPSPRKPAGVEEGFDAPGSQRPPADS